MLRYPPAASGGIVLLERGSRATRAALLDRVRELLRVLDTQSPEGTLWIVEPGRLRIHLRSDDLESSKRARLMYPDWIG